MWQKIKKLIYTSNNFVIATHINPDGDGIGSAAALIELLLHLNKKPIFVCDSPIPKKFAFLDVHDLHKEYTDQMTFPQLDALIVLDTNDLHRIGRLAHLAQQNHVTTICFDHHPCLAPFTEYAIIDSKASSVGILIDKLYRKCGIPLNLQAATGIYTSIICDTGRFSNSSTNREAHLIADECIRYGVDPDLMYSRLYQHVTLNQFKVFAHSLQHVELHLDNTVMIHSICREDCEKTGSDFLEIENIDLEYILELNKQVEDVECVVLLRELPNEQVRISIRSKSHLKIEKLMKKMGGGGHEKAAGATVKGTIEQAKQIVLKLIEKEMNLRGV